MEQLTHAEYVAILAALQDSLRVYRDNIKAAKDHADRMHWAAKITTVTKAMTKLAASPPPPPQS